VEHTYCVIMAGVRGEEAQEEKLPSHGRWRELFPFIIKGCGRKGEGGSGGEATLRGAPKEKTRATPGQKTARTSKL